MTETIIAYGTLMFYENIDDFDPEPVVICGLRRFFRKGSRYPVVVKDSRSSFWGLALHVSDQMLSVMDMMEGTPHIFTRERYAVKDGSGNDVRGWIYIPSPVALLRYNVKTKEDLNDNFIEEIKRSSIVFAFPMLAERIPRKSDPCAVDQGGQ